MLEFEGELLCLQAELLLESNRFAEASDVVREAQAWLRERADRVALSGEERTRFLSMVPSHARIVSLGERLPS
jgi:Arc/MetJ-type ribon-helix-helix transcriptional regulator